MLAGRSLRYAPCMDVIEVMTALETAEQAGAPPPTITADDGVAISQHFHAQLDRGGAMLARQAAELGTTIACGPGCTGCCYELVLVRALEAEEVARWLEQPANAAARATFLDAYPSWRAAVGGAPEQLAALLRTGPQEAYGEAHRAQWRKAVLCAFNHDGACLIYPVRPLACRNAHAVDTSAHCHPADDSGIKPRRVALVPIDNLVTVARRVMRAADRAARGEQAGAESLCKLVAARLHAGPTAPR